MAILYGVLNALLISVSNVAGGVASRRIPLPVVLLLASLSAMAIAVVIAVATSSAPSTQGVALGLIAGLFGGLGLPIAYRAFAIGPVGVAAALLALTTTTLLTAFGIVTGSPVGPARAAGLVLCVVAIGLVSYSPTPARASARMAGPLLAALAALFFSTFVVLIDTVPTTNGFWPVVAARLGVCAISATLFLGWIVTNRSSEIGGSHGRRALGLGALAGGADVLGNLFLVLTLNAGDLVLLALLTPAAPVFTAVIGWLVLREELTPRQIVGLVVASTALVLASV